MSLTSMSTPGTGGTFSVHTHSTNGPIKVIFGDSPVNAVLNFDAQSTNSPVHAVLHPAYEGTFSMHTTNADAVLDDSHKVDPSGHGRRRRLFIDSASNRDMHGELEWLPSINDKQAGSVNISTTNALIKLTI
jgi:hypothetical protein